MSSTRNGLLGVQTPLHALEPVAVDFTDADDAIELGSRYGLTLDEWQEIVLRSWVGRRRDGKWAANRCGLAVPRQNGKNAAVEVRELFGIVFLGEKWLHSAHEVKTARKAFLRLSSFFENPREYPELAELVEDIRKTNGQEAIVLTNGGSVEFVARSKSSGRGFTVDGILLDEAQELTDEALAALLPTKSASPLGNPQTIYTGTPPGPKVSGEVFTRMHAQGHGRKDKRLSWLEWGAPKGADLDDREGWAQANPALGIRLSLDEILDERAQFDDADFGRERLGWWDDPLASGGIMSPSAWAILSDGTVDVRTLGGPVLALDVAPHHASASIVAAGFDIPRALPIVELVESRAGASWIPARAAQLAAQYGATLALNSGGPIGSLIPDLERLGLEWVDIKGGDYAKACGALVASVDARGFRHRGEPEFAAAVLGAKARKVGDGFQFSRSDSSVDITPLVAAAVALWTAARTNNAEPIVLAI